MIADRTCNGRFPAVAENAYCRPGRAVRPVSHEDIRTSATPRKRSVAGMRRAWRRPQLTQLAKPPAASAGSRRDLPAQRSMRCTARIAHTPVPAAVIANERRRSAGLCCAESTPTLTPVVCLSCPFSCRRSHRLAKSRCDTANLRTRRAWRCRWRSRRRYRHGSRRSNR
jgi:hypothetical protein